MKAIIFDTETTGLLKPSAANLSEQPYIIEFYGVAIDENFQILEELETMIKPPLSQLPEVITKITKITDKDLEDAPYFPKLFPKFAKFFTGADIMIAHNAEFDKGMMTNEIKRLGKINSFPWPRHTVCTVEASMPIAGHRLNLSNLHYRLTGQQFADAHRAKNDVFALVRCVHAMVEKGMISWDNYK